MSEINSAIVTVPGLSNRLDSVILAGLEPSIHQSGQIAIQGQMVKRSSTHLRWAILQADIKVACKIAYF